MGGRIIAIEGGDGAGKGTVAKAVHEHLAARGERSVLISFPRYEATLGGRAIGDFLARRVAAPEDPRALAVLYAADRFESKSYLEDLIATNDWIVIDRYVASNMAYQAAKFERSQVSEIARWIERLEFNTFSLPRPHLCVFMDMPVDVAHLLVLRKGSRSYTDAARDLHEADLGLQRRVADAYASFAEQGWVSPWLIVKPYRNALRPPNELAAEILSHLPQRTALPSEQP